MIIQDSTIQAVRDLPIEDVLERYIKIKKNEACCPFHNEKTPSFRISKKNFFKCFGCGEAGDAIAFVQKHDKLTFIEAIERIASAHNIAIEYASNDTPEERQAKITKLDTAKQILNFAHDYYRKALQENEGVKAYLLERGYDDDKIEEWQLGYAPDSFKNITPSIINRGWYDVALEIGLIGTKNEKNFDLYRNRITIPIYDKHGQIIGFGGRAVGDNPPKYINPCESFLYSKSTVLFGLDRAAAAIKEQNRSILTEGYFDVMSMHNAGVENVVAPCGTACDEKQLKLLKRYSNRITIMNDGDKAGQTATLKTLQKAMAAEMDVFCVELTGQDPDELARTYQAQ